MEKIPTANEFWSDRVGQNINQEEYSAIVGFAKLHVEAALKEASEKANIIYEYVGNTNSEHCDEYVNKDSILNSYPLENIK